ncbi:MAG: hypothetical protein ABI577_03505 [bacterium]
MKRVLMAGIGALVAAFSLMLLASCGESKDEGPPIQLQQTDRDSISQIARTYVAALEANDTEGAQALLVDGVPKATVAKSITTVKDEGFHLVSVGDATAVNGSNVEIQVALTDKDGKSVTRKLEFRLDAGEWVVYSPHLKPL